MLPWQIVRSYVFGVSYAFNITMRYPMVTRLYAKLNTSQIYLCQIHVCVLYVAQITSRRAYIESYKRIYKFENGRLRLISKKYFIILLTLVIYKYCFEVAVKHSSLLFTVSRLYQNRLVFWRHVECVRISSMWNINSTTMISAKPTFHQVENIQ